MSEEGPAKAATLSLPCVLIIAIAGVERFAYKGVGSNLVTYLTGVVGMSTAAAAESVITWNGVGFMLPLVSAILAHSYWDRYSTIAASSLLYVLGMVALSAWALLNTRMTRLTWFFPLYLMSIGQGGYQPALQAFGADQLAIGDDDDAEFGMTAEEKGKVKSMFFQWWYFGMCSGTMLGNSIMSYIQDNFGWGLGFAIPSAAMTMSVVAFFSCTPLYKQTQPTGARRPSPCSIFKAPKSIFASRKISLQSRDDDNNGDGDAISELELQKKPLKPEPANNPMDSPDEAAAPGMATVILRLLPIWATLLVFAVIFQQPATFFTKQGTLMDHTVAGGSIVIPPAMLQTSIAASIVLLVPIYDRVIIPLINAATGGIGGITVLQRIGVGMVLSAVAMAAAALVELWRLRAAAAAAAGAGEGAAARLSIFWLLPQYVLLGVADVFTVVGMQEFFYTQVPVSMRTIGIGLYQSVFGVGGFLGALLIAGFETATARPSNARGWFSDDPREAHLDRFYWLLALLCFVSFVIFARLCKYYSGNDASGK